MVNPIKIVVVGLVFAAGATAGASEVQYRGWSLAHEKEQVKRREDPATWFTEVFDADRKHSQDTHARPFTFGVFPVPRYDLVGERSFRGAGTMLVEYPWHDRYLVGTAFFVNRSPVNEAFIGARTDEVYFHILVLSDQKIQEDGSNAFSQIVSRNHPHVIGQGQFKTATCAIDFVAFQTADRNAYAIVDMRLIDLRAGRVVIIAPQKDGTLRSMQVEAPVLASTDLKDFDAELLNGPQVIKFLNMPGNL